MSHLLGMVWYEDKRDRFYTEIFLRVVEWSLIACSLLILSFSSQTGAQGAYGIDWEASVAGLLALSREGQEYFGALDPAIKKWYTTGAI